MILRPVEQVILTALEKDPERRYPTAEAMLAALTRAAAPALQPDAIEQPVTVPQPAGKPTLDQQPRSRPPRYARRRTLSVVAGVLLLLLICAALTPLVFPAYAPVTPVTPTSANKIALAAPATPTMPAIASAAPTPPVTATAAVAAARETLSAVPGGMALVPAGSFTMGAVSGIQSRRDSAARRVS